MRKMAMTAALMAAPGLVSALSFGAQAQTMTETVAVEHFEGLLEMKPNNDPAGTCSLWTGGPTVDVVPAGAIRVLRLGEEVIVIGCDNYAMPYLLRLDDYLDLGSSEVDD